MYQDVDLSEYKNYIEDNRLVISASGWVRNGYLATIKFIFLDENKNVISTPFDPGYFPTEDWWEGSISEEQVPAGTKYLRVLGNGYHPHTITSGSLDDFSVKVKVLS